jgi:hypothetical protein
MPAHKIQRCLAIVCAIIIVSQALAAAYAQVETAQWREASPTKIIIDSTADWGRILFDDLNGTNSNGLRIRSVTNSGWLEGRDTNDQLSAGRKMPWPDTEYDKVVVRKGDMVEFYKGLGDFHPTEIYADLILEVNVELPRVYVWLMTGGNGTTTFEIVNQETGDTMWRDIIVANGETQQVRRVMSPQSFFSPGRTETAIVTWLAIVVLVIVILNFPVVEIFVGLLRRRSTRKSGSDVDHDRSDGGKREATEQK